MKVVVVYEKNTKELFPFTIGHRGDIIITSNREYDIDNLIVSILDVQDVEEIDPNKFVYLSTITGE